MNASLLSSENMCWCTPQDFFDKLDQEFHFVLDAAATDKTAKCKRYYTPITDGLLQSWNCGGSVFCNPPYGREIGKWVQKAHKEAAVCKYPIVLLIPARTDTSYFHNYIYNKAEIRFIRGRLKFTDDYGNAADPAPFPSMLVIYNGQAEKEHYNIILPNNKEDKIMVWDGKALSNIVKECLYDIFAHEIDDNASIMSNKDYADLLKKKHNDSGHSCLDKNVYIHTRSNGIKICFKDGFDKTLLKELDGDNALEISWSMAARHIRAWQTEKKLSAADQSEVDTKSKGQHECDTSHLCGSPYNQDHCSFLLYATEKNAEYNGKPLEQYCVYCTENGKARKIGQMSTWTGLTPKFCSKRKAAEAAENKKEESQMPSFDFSELSGKPDFNFAAFTSQDNQLKMIPFDMLDYNNDYERYDGERYSDMVESIKKNGILQPLIVRSQPDGRFYILAGNNRRYCGEAAGVQMFPCIVKENLTDEEAQAYIDETNVYQRGFSSLKITKQAEVIARRHSQMFDEEKLKAIRREIAMMNGEEFPEDQGGDKLSKLAQVGQEYGLGKDSIARLIRINELVPELKPCVDNGAIAVRTAVNLSYLFVSEQKKVAEMITDDGYAVDMKKSALLKEISAQKQLNDKMIEAIVSGKYNPDAKPPKPKAFKIKSEIAAKYFAPDWDNDKVQEVIAAALEMYYNYDVSAEIGRRTNADNDEQEDG